jgi:uncharacterized membrane protein YtjA (UPF0391 family)
MLGWAITFFVIAIVAGVLGLGSVAILAADIAQLIFFVFIALFIIAALVHALKGNYPPV